MSDFFRAFRRGSAAICRFNIEQRFPIEVRAVVRGGARINRERRSKYSFSSQRLSVKIS